MANSLASSADAVLGASTLPQEPVFFAPIELSGGLYASQRLQLRDKYEAAEMGMAKRSEALQQSMNNTEELLRKQEALNIQSGTISKISEVLEPLSPTYSEDRTMFLDMASRSPAVASALMEADRNRTHFNRVLDNYSKVVAEGSVGEYADPARAQMDIMGAYELLRNRGSAALPIIRMSQFKYYAQAARAKAEHNQNQWELSQLRKSQAEDLEFEKTLGTAPIDMGFGDDKSAEVQNLIMNNDFKGVEGMAVTDFLENRPPPELPEGTVASKWKVKALDASSMAGAFSLGLKSFKTKFMPTPTTGHVPNTHKEYTAAWEAYLEDLHKRLSSVNDVKTAKREYDVVRRRRGTTSPSPASRPSNAPVVAPSSTDSPELLRAREDTVAGLLARPRGQGK
jgi:hypothetical protein